MGQQPFRVHIAEPKLRDAISSQLVEYLCPTDELMLGYQIDSPDEPGGIYALMSGAGAVLGRARSEGEIVQILMNHLAGRLADPPPPGYLRIDLRVLSSEARTVLVGPTLATKPTLIERSMERAGVYVVDSPFVDLDPETGQVAQFIVPGGVPIAESVGVHLSPTGFDAVITDLLWPGVYLPSDLSNSLVTREVARFVRNGDRAARLSGSRLLAERLRVQLVGSRHSKDVIDAIVQSA